MQKMSEKEAIAIIKSILCEYRKKKFGENALHMAIQALEKQSMVNEILHECTELKRELDAYKEQEKQGLLLRLPCKVGDTVYEASKDWNRVMCHCVVSVALGVEKRIFIRNGYGNVFEFGVEVFLTKEEAEAALEKMKGEEHE